MSIDSTFPIDMIQTNPIYIQWIIYSWDFHMDNYLPWYSHNLFNIIVIHPVFELMLRKYGLVKESKKSEEFLVDSDSLELYASGIWYFNFINVDTVVKWLCKYEGVVTIESIYYLAKVDSKVIRPKLLLLLLGPILIIACIAICWWCATIQTRFFLLFRLIIHSWVWFLLVHSTILFVLIWSFILIVTLIGMSIIRLKHIVINWIKYCICVLKFCFGNLLECRIIIGSIFKCMSSV